MTARDNSPRQSSPRQASAGANKLRLWGVLPRILGLLRVTARDNSPRQSSPRRASAGANKLRLWGVLRVTARDSDDAAFLLRVKSANVLTGKTFSVEVPRPFFVRRYGMILLGHSSARDDGKTPQVTGNTAISETFPRNRGRGFPAPTIRDVASVP